MKLHSKSWSKTTQSKPCSSPRMRRVMPGIASRCSSAASMWLQDRKPLVDVVMALNLTVSGIVAHPSAMKNGELMKIPQYKI